VPLAVRGFARVRDLVLVVMITVGRVPMSVVCVVDVVVMGYRFVSAAWPVHVGVADMGQMRQRVLVVVIIMWRVGVSFVHVVDMSLALGTGVSAAGPVYVIVVVNVMLGCHRSSLLC
jgi:hypothetical protein